jgi:7-carboxy-7-deazaguanine synthase
MHINDIFYSIQGEGNLSGLPTIFIRTAGCNLRCNYCDTTEAYQKGTEHSIDEIIGKIRAFNCNMVCITGGEPLLQKQIYSLIDHLIDNHYHCSIETNGSINIKQLTEFEPLLISMDLKCPCSQMHNQNKLENIALLRKQDQLKCIIETVEDYQYAKNILQHYQPVCTRYMQPVWGSSVEDLADRILKDNLSVRLGIQLHKIIWGNQRSR